MNVSKHTHIHLHECKHFVFLYLYHISFINSLVIQWSESKYTIYIIFKQQKNEEKAEEELYIYGSVWLDFCHLLTFNEYIYSLIGIDYAKVRMYSKREQIQFLNLWFVKSNSFGTKYSQSHHIILHRIQIDTQNMPTNTTRLNKKSWDFVAFFDLFYLQIQTRSQYKKLSKMLSHTGKQR